MRLMIERLCSDWEAEGILALKRSYWAAESRLHHGLDITLREDQSRVLAPAFGSAIDIVS